MVRDFRDLVAWQLCNTLRAEIIALTEDGPIARDFRFRDDLRAASASAPANIAEGFGRYGPGEFARFLGYAKGSLAETENHLIDAFQRGYISEPRYSRLLNLTRSAARVTTNLLRAKQRQAAREQKTKRPGSSP